MQTTQIFAITTTGEGGFPIFLFFSSCISVNNMSITSYFSMKPKSGGAAPDADSGIGKNKRQNDDVSSSVKSLSSNSPSKKAKTATATATETTEKKILEEKVADEELTEIWEPFASVNGTWRRLLEPELKKNYFMKLRSFVSREIKTKTVYPPANEIFSFLNLCSFEDVKVCIIGQDPYHGAGQAHGVAFSVKRGVKVPPSLRNMYKELEQDLSLKPPSHGNLVNWSKQGVLMINTCLTVRSAEANSHQKQGWEVFTDAIIRELSKHNPGLVFLCWGKPAQTKCASIDKKKHKIITSSHPSPLSAYSTTTPFIGSKCFSRCNELLRELGRTEIDWKVPE